MRLGLRDGDFFFGHGRRGLAQWKKLLPVNGNITRGFNTQANLAPVDIHDRDANILAYENLLAEFSAEYQHVATLLQARQRCASSQAYFTLPVSESNRKDNLTLRRMPFRAAGCVFRESGTTDATLKIANRRYFHVNFTAIASTFNQVALQCLTIRVG